VRYIVFPSYQSKDKSIRFEQLISDKITIVCGPTVSGLYIIDGSISDINILKEEIYPYYILMEDFESPTIH